MFLTQTRWLYSTNVRVGGTLQQPDALLQTHWNPEPATLVRPLPHVAAVSRQQFRTYEHVNETDPRQSVWRLHIFNLEQFNCFVQWGKTESSNQLSGTVVLMAAHSGCTEPVLCIVRQLLDCPRRPKRQTWNQARYTNTPICIYTADAYIDIGLLWNMRAGVAAQLWWMWLSLTVCISATHISHQLNALSLDCLYDNIWSHSDSN